MQKVYKAPDYLLAFLVMLGCALFILCPVNDYSIASFVAKLLLAMYMCIEEFRKIFSGIFFFYYLTNDIHREIVRKFPFSSHSC